MIDFLVDAFGFETAVVLEDSGAVRHAELRWPLGGGVMLSDRRESDGSFQAQLSTGPISLYVVCDDPDGVFERATRHGAEILRDLEDADYGSRGFTSRDPEGNFWSFGTYRGR